MENNARIAKPLPLWSRIFEASTNINSEVEGAFPVGVPALTVVPENDLKSHQKPERQDQRKVEREWSNSDGSYIVRS